MNALVTSLWVLTIVVAGAFVGAAIGKRLPREHLSSASTDIVKFGAGWIATLAALVLGLLVASAKSPYDTQAAEVEQAAAKIILLDQILRQHGPEAKPTRERLRALVAARHALKWVASESRDAVRGNASVQGSTDIDTLRSSVAALAPTTDGQRSARARALSVVDDFAQLRWLFITQAVAGI